MMLTGNWKRFMKLTSLLLSLKNGKVVFICLFYVWQTTISMQFPQLLFRFRTDKNLIPVIYNIYYYYIAGLYGLPI